MNLPAITRFSGQSRPITPSGESVMDNTPPEEDRYTGPQGHELFAKVVSKNPELFIAAMDEFSKSPTASKELPLLYMNQGFANPNSEAPADGVVLSRAIRAIYAKGFKLLMQHPDLNVNLGGGPKKSTPLHEAARHGNLYALHRLLNRGAEIDKGDVSGYTPLMRAIEETQVDAVEALIAAKANVNAKARHSDSTPLSLACFDFHHTFPPPYGEDLKRYLKIIKMLLDAGADADALEDGETQLMKAISGKTKFLPQAFIEYGVNLNTQSSRGDTALDFAEAYQQTDIAKKLKAAGAKYSRELGSE